MVKKDGKPGRVGRPEKPLDPNGGPAAAFGCALRELRRSAGEPTYAALAKRTGISSSALSEATRGRRLPSWPTVEAFVRGCGTDPQPWRPRWEAARDALQVADSASPPGGGTAIPGWRAVEGYGHAAVEDRPERGRAPRLRRRPFAVAGASALLLFAGAMIGAKMPHRPASRASHSPAASPLAWTRIAGPGCAPGIPGAQADVDEGWSPASGGWTGDGCSGKSVTTRLSGAPDFWERTVGWAFEPMTRRACRLEVYIPDDPGAAGVATYHIYGKDPNGKPIASPQVAQARYHSRWVGIGTYHSPDGIITVELGNVGLGTAFIAADAMRATCQ
jgi:transcriptional regulator with XRE-family HTH domain